MASRLIDKLIVNPFISRVNKQALLNSHVIVADNVAGYLYETYIDTGKTYGEITESIQRITPPFENVFIQYRSSFDQTDEWGWLIERTQLDDPDVRWRLNFYLFSDLNYEVPFIALWNVNLDEFGYSITKFNELNPGISVDIARHVQRIKGQQEFELFVKAMLHEIITAFFVLAFLNTKNVIMEAVEPNAAINKKRQKHHKRPLMRYHVLKIKPMGREAGHDQGGTHASPALHIRRGHFKTYTDAAPLFGKYVGTFWVDQHIAGKKSDRVVVKDYEVLAPEPA